MSTMEVMVARKAIEAERICSFELRAADGAVLPAFSAGAHIDVHIGDGLIRQYSLCNNPEERQRYLIAVQNDPATRGGSIAMHERLRAGDRLRISEPRNHFPLVPAERSLLFAGGIGITPILCMAEQLANGGADFEMHYCVRSRERAAFLERIATSPYASRLHLHVSDGGARQDYAALVGAADTGTHLYACGPAGFIDAVTGAARQNGWAAANVHQEYFGAPVPTAAAGEAFEVRIASSGKCYTVPADKSVIRVLEENGVFVPVSCEQGVCGTCITGVLDGVPDHRDLYFTDEEKAGNTQFTPCCSRAKSAHLVLDL